MNLKEPLSVRPGVRRVELSGELGREQCSEQLFERCEVHWREHAKMQVEVDVEVQLGFRLDELCS
ncbi:MAG TPA: hypothetical protein VMH22_13230 [bacterium]|nr:hypothetical protein [bacterium]